MNETSVFPLPLNVEIEPIRNAQPEGLIFPFNYEGVELLPSRLNDQYQQTRNFYLTTSNDDILRGFRQRAGLDAPGNDLGGWYSGDDKGKWYSGGFWSHAFGQWLSAFSRMARATNDMAIREKATYLLHEWGRTISSDGFSGAMARRGTAWVGHYEFEKLCGGLVDMIEYLGSEEAANYLAIIIAWASKNLGRIRSAATREDPSGSGGDGQVEWYTLSENLYRAYKLTGHSEYRDFARVWHYSTMWNDLASGKDAFLWKHAYSHVNALSSAAMAYATIGDEQYLRAIVNGYDILQRDHLYVTGGYGNKEVFTPADGSLGESLIDNRNWLDFRTSFEVPCGSWAGFKLSRYLMHFTGEARFGDWIEQLLYNGIGAALPMRGNGDTFYYADYTMIPYASKEYHPEPWPCCSGTYPISTADYHNLIYYRDQNGLYVNLFVPSTVIWEQEGVKVSAIMETNFPEDGEVCLRVKTDRPLEWALRFRVPAWVDGSIQISLGDCSTTLELPKGQWATIKRVWADNDIVRITFPLNLTFKTVDSSHPSWCALTVGPVVLVSSSGPVIGGPRELPASFVSPTSRPLHYYTLNAPDTFFRPYYDVTEGIKYWMYLNVED